MMEQELYYVQKEELKKQIKSADDKSKELKEIIWQLYSLNNQNVSRMQEMERSLDNRERELEATMMGQEGDDKMYVDSMSMMGMEALKKRNPILKSKLDDNDGAAVLEMDRRSILAGFHGFRNRALQVKRAISAFPFKHAENLLKARVPKSMDEEDISALDLRNPKEE